VHVDNNPTFAEIDAPSIGAASADPCFSIRPWMCKTFLTGHHLASQTVSPAGPCFSPGSALWPSQYGIRRMKRNNLRRVLHHR
jgi:hypothetical protein